MKYLNTYKQFEDVTSAPSIAGMGGIVSSQPGSLPVITGSGDVGFTISKKRRKKAMLVK